MKVLRVWSTPTSNSNVGGRNFWKGWCHAHVRSGFGIGAKAGYGSATQAWQKAKRKHSNRSFPVADVPVFFSLKNEPAGHVAVRLKNGKVVTSGLNDTQMTFDSLDALLKRWTALNYLGWTEDLNGADIITGYKPEDNKPSKSISQMADEVIAGKHGNGHANRQKSLGVDKATYEKVRAEVNRRTATPAGKSVSQMATEVIQGKHGNGHANRRKSLGVSSDTYAKVRAEVNRRLG